MFINLLAFVEYNKINPIIFQKDNNGLFILPFCAAYHQPHSQQTTFSICKGHNISLLTFNNNDATFPVVEVFLTPHKCWSLFNIGLIGFISLVFPQLFAVPVSFLPVQLIIVLAAYFSFQARWRIHSWLIRIREHFINQPDISSLLNTKFNRISTILHRQLVISQSVLLHYSTATC